MDIAPLSALAAATSEDTPPARGGQPYEKPQLRLLDVRETNGKPFPTASESTTFTGPGS